MSTYFSDRSFKFLRGLARHNEREWFHAHKADYEQYVRGPFLALIADLLSRRPKNSWRLAVPHPSRYALLRQQSAL
jgi:uncharacterized protein (DUF2461 family)